MRLIARWSSVAVAALILAGCAHGTGPDSANPDLPTPSASDDLTFDPSAPLEPQMTEAIKADNLDLVRDILAAGYDPTADLGAGWNALHWAAVGSDPQMVRVLADAGVPLEDRGTGRTPLHLAAERGVGPVVTALLEVGADESAPFGPFGATPLHVAAQYGNVEAILALLDWGMDIDVGDDDQSTPLMWACFYDQYLAAETLLIQGADVTLRDVNGTTALGGTDAEANPELAQLIKDFGGEL